MLVTRDLLFPLAFYKKSKFNGSKGMMNYRIEKVSSEEGDQFQFTVWKGPYCFDATKEEKTSFFYPFTREGLDEIRDYINGEL